MVQGPCSQQKTGFKLLRFENLERPLLLMASHFFSSGGQVLPPMRRRRLFCEHGSRRLKVCTRSSTVGQSVLSGGDGGKKAGK